MAWLPDGEKNVEDIICLFVLTKSTNVTDRQTHRRTDTAWRHRPRLHSIARQKHKKRSRESALVLLIEKLGSILYPINFNTSKWSCQDMTLTMNRPLLMPNFVNFIRIAQGIPLTEIYPPKNPIFLKIWWSTTRHGNGEISNSETDARSALGVSHSRNALYKCTILTYLLTFCSILQNYVKSKFGILLLKYL